MAGGAIKYTDLRQRITPASILVDRYRAFILAIPGPWAQLLQAQDTTVGDACRVLCSFGLDGQDAFGGQDGSSLDDGFTAPDHGRYSIFQTRARLTPGAFVIGRLLYIPAGYATGTNAGDPRGTESEVEVSLLFEGANSSSSIVEQAVPMDGSTFYDGGTGQRNAVPTEAWQSIREAAFPLMVPVEQDDATLPDYSEWCDVTITVYADNNFRVIDFVLWETPWVHAQVADPSSRQSVHSYRVGGRAPTDPQTPGPQTDAIDGPTYGEHRFGTNHLGDVQRQQGERLGPRILSWHSWHPAAMAADWRDRNVQQLVLASSGSYQDIFDSSVTTWSANNPGWLVDGIHALLHEYNDGVTMLGTGRAIVPVRARARGSLVSAGSATLRLQSSLTEWIDLEFTSTTIGWVEAVGFLECQVAGDQIDRAILQAFHTGDSLELESIAVDFGWW